MGLQYGGDYRGMRKISVQDLFRSDQDMTISRIWMRDPFWYDKLSKGDFTVGTTVVSHFNRFFPDTGHVCFEKPSRSYL